MKNKLIFILLVVLLPTCASSQVKEFKISNMPDIEISFTIKDSIMELFNVPQDEYYNYIQFEGEKKKVADGKVSFRLPYEKDDRNLIFSNCNDVWKILNSTGYKNYCNGWDLYFFVENGECFFELPPVYEINKLIYFSDKNPQDFLTADRSVQSDNEEIIAKAKEITVNCETDYEKAKSIHDWVAANIYYNMDGYYSSSYGSTDALGVLQDKKTVCQGYANLTAALLRSLQIPCRVVSGYALGIGTRGSWSIRNIGEATNHAWNEAFISGRWIIIDATWDSDMQYRNGQFERGKGLRGWKYFDPTLEAFSFDHKYCVYDKTINEKIANITEDYIWQTISSKHKKLGNDTKMNEYIAELVSGKIKDFLQDYEFYKKTYPDGRYVNNCELDIIDMKMIIEYINNSNLTIYNMETMTEDNFWRESELKNTIESLSIYKKKYPSGRYIELCEKNMRILNAKETWAITNGSKDENKLLDFIINYYDCSESDLAKLQLSNLYEAKGDMAKVDSSWDKAIEFYNKAIVYNNSNSIVSKKNYAYSEIVYSKFATNQNIENGENYMAECPDGKYFFNVYEKLYILYFNAAEFEYKAKNYKKAREYYMKIVDRERKDKMFTTAEKQIKKINKNETKK
ncbi:MAG: transglutaminase-like domain-containing protein [Prevotellaceae bacterium]|jgi:hypothetical protein|nr:transglutaminase-like domain-containing protein [Prevotellaceae bacterium]